jgi:hypothetical protein
MFTAHCIRKKPGRQQPEGMAADGRKHQRLFFTGIRCALNANEMDGT